MQINLSKIEVAAILDWSKTIIETETDCLKPGYDDYSPTDIQRFRNNLKAFKDLRRKLRRHNEKRTPRKTRKT